MADAQDGRISLSPLELGLLLLVASAGSAALVTHGFNMGLRAARAGGAEGSSQDSAPVSRTSQTLEGLSLDPWSSSRDGFEVAWVGEVARSSPSPTYPIGVDCEAPSRLYVVPEGGQRLLVGTTQELFLASSGEEIRAGAAQLVPPGPLFSLGALPEGAEIWGWAMEPGAVATFFEAR